VDWLPSRLQLPTACTTDIDAAAARDIITALQNPSTESPLHTLNTDKREELARLADIFSATSLPVQDDDIIIEKPPPETIVKVPRVSFKEKLTDTDDNTTAIMAAHLREHILMKESDTEIIKMYTTYVNTMNHGTQQEITNMQNVDKLVPLPKIPPFLIPLPRVPPLPIQDKYTRVKKEDPVTFNSIKIKAAQRRRKAKLEEDAMIKTINEPTVTNRKNVRRN
jgi:hypothetical protein